MTRKSHKTDFLYLKPVNSATLCTSINLKAFVMNKKLDDEILEKIDALDERINKVRSDYNEDKEKHEGKPAEDETPEIRLGRAAASMFLGNVIAGFILGFLADKYLGTAPWGIMLCIILGFVAGVYRAQSLFKKNE